MTKIDIDKLTEAELVDLNHRMVERLRFLHQMRAHKSMLEFSLGERVWLSTRGTTAALRCANEVQQEDGRIRSKLAQRESEP